MKIWISDTNTPTHRLVKLNAEDHSAYKYLGDLSEEELRDFLLSIKEDIDVTKNINMLNYFGYLHILDIKKS